MTWICLLGALATFWLAGQSGRRALSVQRARQLSDALEPWAAHAEAHGLTWRPAGELVGSVLHGVLSGRRLRAEITETPRVRQGEIVEVRLTVALRIGLPAELELVYNPRLVPIGYTMVQPGHPEWGSGLMVQREHLGEVQSLFSPTTLDAVGRYLMAHDGRIHQGQLEAHVNGVPEPEGMLEEALAVAALIQEAWERRWRRLAQQLGLRFRSMDSQGRWRLVGTWGELPVSVRCSMQDIELHAHIAGVPEGMRVESGGTGGARSGNPILDHLLTLTQPAPCLQDAELAGALVAALHPHPGAVFSSEGLRIPAPPNADIRALLGLAAAVQAALSRA